jgi:hypothetical protein
MDHVEKLKSALPGRPEVDRKYFLDAANSTTWKTILISRSTAFRRMRRYQLFELLAVVSSDVSPSTKTIHTSISWLENHARGLIPFCQQNPRLKVERKVSLSKNRINRRVRATFQCCTRNECTISCSANTRYFTIRARKRQMHRTLNDGSGCLKRRRYAIRRIHACF